MTVMTVSMSAPSQSTEPPAERRFPALDGLVGVAVLGFVASVLSVPALGGGWIGLEVMLAIVGLRITRWVVERPRCADAGREVLIVGGQLVGVLVFVAGWTYSQDGTLTAPVQRATAAVVLQGYNFGRVVGGVDERAFAELWPVSLIAQFALVAVVGSALTARWPAARRVALVGGLAVLVVVGRTLQAAGRGDTVAADLLPWFRLDGLLIGAAAALVLLRRPLTASRRLHDWSFVAAMWLAGAVVILPPRVRWSEPDQLLALPLAALATTALVAALVTGCAPSLVQRVLTLGPLRFLGRRWVAVALSCHPVGVMLAAGGRAGWQGWAMLGGQLAFIGFAVWASFELIERPLGAAYELFVRRYARTA